MDIENRRALKEDGARALAANPGDPRMLVLAYAGGIALMALLATIATHIVGLRIEDTGGLRNMGLRSILSTVQTVLPLASSVITLLLTCGYHSAAMKMARRQSVGPQSLLEGFRRLGPLFRLGILQSVIYLAVGFISMYAGSIIFMMTPLSNDFMALMMPLMDSITVMTEQITLDAETLQAATEALVWAIPIVLGVFLILAAPLFYQYRMCLYALFDDPARGALAAMRSSRNMMKGNRVSMFKLDLSFWWFYALEILISLIAYGDMLLPLIGISFPWPDTVSFYLFYVLSLGLQVAVYHYFLNRVNVTYAIAYEILKPETPEPTKVALGNIFDLAKDYQE